MNTPAQEHVCYDFLYSFAQWLLRHSELEGRESDAKDLERNLAAKITALLNDYFACDALIHFGSYLDAEAERYCSANDERRKLIVENVKNDFDNNISGLVGIAKDNAENHDKKCRELARKDWLNHVDFMALIGILDGVKSLKLDEARIEDKQYLVESFKGCLPSEKLILLNESPAFPCTPMELADWFEQIKLSLNKIIPSFIDELAAIEATKAKASPEPAQATGGVEAGNQQEQGRDARTDVDSTVKRKRGRQKGETTAIWEYIDNLWSGIDSADSSKLWKGLENHVNKPGSPITAWNKTVLTWRKSDGFSKDFNRETFMARMRERLKQNAVK